MSNLTLFFILLFLGLSLFYFLKDTSIKFNDGVLTLEMYKYETDKITGLTNKIKYTNYYKLW
jgi:hypothetical protein